MKLVNSSLKNRRFITDRDVSNREIIEKSHKSPQLHFLSRMKSGQFSFCPQIFAFRELYQGLRREKKIIRIACSSNFFSFF